MQNGGAPLYISRTSEGYLFQLSNRVVVIVVPWNVIFFDLVVEKKFYTDSECNTTIENTKVVLASGEYDLKYYSMPGRLQHQHVKKNHHLWYLEDLLV